MYAKISLDDKEYKTKIKQSEDLAKSFAFDLSKAWDTVKAGAKLVAGGVATVTGALIAVSEATEEYRIAQGKLNTAFDAAGFSSESAATAYNEFYKILGDTDTATEASQLLAKLAENEQDITTWTRTAAGVFGTFGDALPIEGLIESANETAKVGQITGVLADALNWAGISEDEFNKKLAAAGSESERNQMIMETLAETYDAASDSFYQNNEQIIKNREQQAKLTEAMAKVGDAVDKVKSALMEQFIPIIADASENLTGWLQNLDINSVIDTAVNKITEIKDAFLNLAPAIAGVITAITVFRTIMTISTIIDGVTKAMNAFKTAQEAATIAQAALNFVMNLNPFVLIATLIAGVVAALVVLWHTNEDVRDALKPIWETIKNIFRTAWETIKTVWSYAAPFFKAIWESIKSTFYVVSAVLGAFFQAAWEAVKYAWSYATSYFQAIWNTIKGIFSVVAAVFRGDFQGAWDAIVSIFSGWRDFFAGLFRQMVDAFSNIGEAFAGLGKLAIDALKNAISAAWRGLKNTVNGLWDSLFSDKTANVRINATGTAVNGSHKTGLSYVPFDGYIAELHKGERVLTASEASRYNSGGDFGNVQIIVNAAKGQDENKISQLVMEKMEFERKRRAAAFA